MSKVTTDVVIVGAGPGGSSAAYALAQRGIGVVVLEKHDLPRYKTCGGGVNVRAAQHIPFPIDSVVERVIHTYKFTFRGKNPFVRSYPKPLTYMTQRSNLDKFLMDKACEVGARLISGTTVRSVSVTDHDVSIMGSSGELVSAQVVVGADGANSVVARSAGLADGIKHELAMESEILLSSDELAAWGDVIEIELFGLKYGYGWVFPKARHISIGVGGLKSDVDIMKKYNLAYLASHEKAPQKVLKYSGHMLPIRANDTPLVKGRTLLVGDAAGLLEPFTGEGIGYAVRSGQLAAEAIADYLSGKDPSLEPYQKRANLEIISELRLAHEYVRLFNRFPRLFYGLIRRSDYAWESACKILRGERNFSDINSKLGWCAPIVSALA